MNEKTCTKCGETKALDEIRKDNHSKSGYGSWCKACSSLQTWERRARQNAGKPKRVYESKGIEHKKERLRVYRVNNQEKIRNSDREYKMNNREKGINTELKRRYGITLQEYIDMLMNQNSVCAICKQAEIRVSKSGKVKALAVDHCHKTGRVRGLLCHRCNSAIAYINDNENIALEMYKYLSPIGGLTELFIEKRLEAIND